MKKIVAIIMTLAIVSGVFVIPVSAQQNIYSAYLEVLNEAFEQYGEFENVEYDYSTGIGYVKLIDFDMDGTDELLFCTGERYDNGTTYGTFEYRYHIYGYSNGSAVLLDEGSMEAHGGDANWKIHIAYNLVKHRLFKYRCDGLYMSSVYITVGELDNGSWTEYKDWFVSEYIEIGSEGDYYNEYYIGGEQVEYAEYQNRFNALSRHGGGYDISWRDFSGSYLNEVVSYLNDMNNQYVGNVQTDWETGKYEAIAVVGDYIYYAGPCYLEDGSLDGFYGLRMYNSKTREDILLINRLCRMDIIGDKVFVIGGGVSSGHWSRILVVMDVGSKEGIRITSGIDIDFSMTDTPYSIFNNRIYIGHQTDMEHYEIISFNLDGSDMRVEVPPIETSALYSDMYETYAVIDGVTYYYNYRANSNVSVVLNDREIEFDQPPVIIDGRTLVPIRAVFEALGYEVMWYEKERKVCISNNYIKVFCYIESAQYEIYDANDSMDIGYFDVPPQVINDRTLMPLRIICELFGNTVVWDEATKTIDITSIDIPEGFERIEYLENLIKELSEMKGKVPDNKTISGFLDYTGIPNPTNFFDSAVITDMNRSDKSSIDIFCNIERDEFLKRIEKYLAEINKNDAVESIYEDENSITYNVHINGRKLFMVYYLDKEYLWIYWPHSYFVDRYIYK